MIVEPSYLEAEVLFEVFDDHDQEGKLDAESLAGVCWAGDEGRGDVLSHDFEHRALDLRVRDTLDVAISD